jgi:hypothetical protein
MSDVPSNWDEHYSNPENLDFTPALLLVEVARMLPPGRAPDLAPGPGRNTFHLAALALFRKTRWRHPHQVPRSPRRG